MEIEANKWHTQSTASASLAYVRLFGLWKEPVESKQRIFPFRRHPTDNNKGILAVS